MNTQTIPSMQEVFALQLAAQRADRAFHDALVAQFGARDAGEMRYQTIRHDARVFAAAMKYRDANEAAHKAFISYEGGRA